MRKPYWCFTSWKFRPCLIRSKMNLVFGWTFSLKRSGSFHKALIVKTERFELESAMEHSFGDSFIRKRVSQKLYCSIEQNRSLSSLWTFYTATSLPNCLVTYVKFRVRLLRAGSNWRRQEMRLMKGFPEFANSTENRLFFESIRSCLPAEIMLGESCLFQHNGVT